MSDQDSPVSAPDSAPYVHIRQLPALLGQTVRLRGWVSSSRSSGKIAFLQIRDGSALLVQAVVSKAEVSAESWEAAVAVTQESSIELTGTVRADKRSASGVELGLAELRILHLTQDFPITPKDHGTAFLMENRHLWLRSSRQRAAIRVRSEVCQGIRDFFYNRDFTLIDSPILTPAACEGTSNLFETDYFGDKAYLSQSGQLYLEPAAAAFGKVYCFGPTFRAEKSKTRRHLMEFWMVEPEVAFLEFPGLQDLAEEFIVTLVARVLDRCREDLKVLERDTAKLEAIQRPFPRVDYTEAIAILQRLGSPIQWGDDFGGDEETLLTKEFDRPLMIGRFPTKIKAFYMQPDPANPDVVLGMDVIAPEGYGEIIGGSQRIHDHDLLLQRIQEHGLPIEAFQWYLDVRKYGSFPHSGFGMGVERFVAWMTGVTHLRETIPYPRLLYKIYP
jgi:asparaginyl-tRNA synthetase